MVRLILAICIAVFGVARVSHSKEASLRYVIKECEHLITGPDQINSFDTGNGYRCCMCYMGTYVDKICRLNESNSTICKPCVHNSTHMTYMNFEPHDQRKCFRDTTTCVPMMKYVRGTRFSKARCECPDGFIKVQDICLPKIQILPTVESLTTLEIKSARHMNSSSEQAANLEVTSESPISVPATTFDENYEEKTKSNGDYKLNLTTVAVIAHLATIWSMSNNTSIGISGNSTELASFGSNGINIIISGICTVGFGIALIAISVILGRAFQKWFQGERGREQQVQYVPVHFLKSDQVVSGNLDKEIHGYKFECGSKEEPKLSAPPPECFGLLNNSQPVVREEQQIGQLPVSMSFRNPEDLTESEKLSVVFMKMAIEITEKDLTEVGRNLLPRRHFEEIFYNKSITYKSEKAHMIFGRAKDLSKNFKLEDLLRAVEGLSYLEEIVCEIAGKLRTDGNVD